MKCLYCDYETKAVDQQDAFDEIDIHNLKVHPDSTVEISEAITILALHTQYSHTNIDQLIREYFEIRTKISDEYRKHRLKDRFVNGHEVS